MIYRYFRDHFYNHVNHVHCPSEFMVNELLKRDYHATIHTISNGVLDISITTSSKSSKTAFAFL